MSKKKQQKNGFFYYMLDMQQDFKQQGRVVAMRDMPIFAGPSWSKLSDAQKQRYNVRAKSAKGSSVEAVSGPSPPRSVANPGTENYGRRDCAGILLAGRRDVEGEMLARRERERKEIHSMLPAGKRATLEDFWLIDIQSLCQIPHKYDSKYLPCEVGVVRYSLNQGVKSKFHRFIRPGPIPIGYRFLAQSTSDATNQVPVEGVPEAEGDYRKLLGDLEQYLTCDRAGATLPPVFTKRAFVDCVEWSLQWLADIAGVTNRITRVYEVESLVGQLVLHSDGKMEISPFVVEELLRTSNYEHDSCTRCDYHDELDCIHCSLGISHTYCYVMSELLCPIFNIAITRHHLSIVPPAVLSSKKIMYSAPRSAGRGVGVARGAVPRGRGLGRGGVGRGIASAELRQPIMMGRGHINFPYPEKN